MPSRINSTTTSPGGLISTGDSDNSLLIQTGDTTAITISSTQQVTLTNPLPVGSGGTGANSASAARTALGTNDAANITTGAVAVANGGTGQTTATAAYNALNPMTTTGDIIYEASPTVAARLPIGSTGQILTVSGGIPAWSTPGSSFVGFRGQTFTSNGTFTIPSGITAVKITVVGGGGGGGGATTNSEGGTFRRGAGGGGGGSAISYLTSLTPGNTLSVTIGGSGTGGSGNEGTGGGTSSVASGTQSITTISATGGSGTSNFGNSGGSGGSGSNGTINMGGGGGFYGGSASSSGSGGSSILGGGGTPRQSSTQNGEAGRNYGGGGSGGCAAGNDAVSNGGNGGPGVVIFEW